MKPHRSVRAALRRRAESAMTSSAFLAAERRLDFWRLRAVVRRGRSFDGGLAYDHLLIATIGLGNIGDQAMVEAFLDNVEGRVAIIVGASGAFELPAKHSHRAAFVVLPTLVQHWPAGRGHEIRKFARLALEANTCCVVGADIMGGHYDARESILRSRMIELASRAGCTTAILGFSWNANPHPKAKRGVQRVSAHAVLFARDPVSAQRLVSDGVPNVRAVADVAFAGKWAAGLATPADHWLQKQRELGRAVVVVNASGHLASHGLLDEYGCLIRELMDRRVSVVLLPHVIRLGDDDSEVCDAIANWVGPDPHLMLIRQLLTPGQVRSLVAEVDAVFTARMHLSILSLLSTTPVVVVNIQGKVKGMLELFNLGDFHVEPVAEDIVSRATELLDRALSDSNLRDAIAESLGPVRRLAESQFEPIRNAASMPTT